MIKSIGVFLAASFLCSLVGLGCSAAPEDQGDESATDESALLNDAGTCWNGLDCKVGGVPCCPVSGRPYTCKRFSSTRYACQPL